MYTDFLLLLSFFSQVLSKDEPPTLLVPSGPRLRRGTPVRFAVRNAPGWQHDWCGLFARGAAFGSGCVALSGRAALHGRCFADLEVPTNAADHGGPLPVKKLRRLSSHSPPLAFPFSLFLSLFLSFHLYGASFLFCIYSYCGMCECIPEYVKAGEYELRLMRDNSLTVVARVSVTLTEDFATVFGGSGNSSRSVGSSSVGSGSSNDTRGGGGGGSLGSSPQRPPLASSSQRRAALGALGALGAFQPHTEDTTAAGDSGFSGGRLNSIGSHVGSVEIVGGGVQHGAIYGGDKFHTPMASPAGTPAASPLRLPVKLRGEPRGL